MNLDRDLLLPTSLPLVKICGVRTPADLEACAAAGANSVGLVFAPGSPRELAPTEVIDLIAEMPDELEPIALFVDPANDLVDAWPGAWIQLHGEETPERVTAIAAMTGHRIIKAIPFDADAVLAWDEHPDVEILLIDGPRGGSGEPFDHAALAPLLATLAKPVIIAGGLDPETVAEVVRGLQPFGVDVSSGVESTRGIKDHDRIRAFVAAARG
ncbi:MAG: phosphoribosylanthranilate isomerase [Planctomycetota bacterium]|nr:phosphoribosylanthranilate isomerase [Planctomycetota bacterium]